MVIGWISVAFVLGVLIFSLWVMRRQDRMFPKGTRVGDGDGDRKPDNYRWVGWWHRGGGGGGF